MTNLIAAGQGSAEVLTEEHHSDKGVFGERIYTPENYTVDVRMILEETVNKYGEEEWRRVALTVEIHRHLGVYAIIGAKMGILAKEILGGTESLRVNSSAGDKPPLSCLNDGIQVSTGATLGHGSIAISSLAEKEPVAVFSSGDQKVRISLKENIRERTDKQLREILHRCGGLTDEYWDEVRELGLIYWRDLDRKEIFEVVAE